MTLAPSRFRRRHRRERRGDVERIDRHHARA
eukprot:CAMPEP_0179614938 /NCGR_PEP_ID=MMETSP0930-20121108/5813_1 /TAXON_ID=548131 ORGANISM="Ostreococcus mediterraneus, Strain clade-D-RCC1621" /NCGR_SAMPLE_ID=MMETSP0930 /ASSEMBLY_ACC=CAM_ASM_000580 /LENGTH=30 /DNA_ID= /DNA_START= /DNA_END= /DNA_ORIENTATION=